MQRNPPIRHDPERNIWVVSRYDDIVQIMRDTDAFEVRLATMPAADRATHARVRRVIARGFVTDQVKALVSLTRDRARELVDEIAAKGSCELVRDYAAPIAMAVVGAMLGIGPDRFADLKRWSEAFLHTENPLLTASEREWHRSQVGECHAFMSEHIGRLKDSPRGPYVPEYLTGQDDSEGLTLSEQVDVAMFLIIAGSETTSALIANAVLRLVEDPALQSKIREEARLILPFVEEILRIDFPVQRTRRQATCPIDIGGVSIPQWAVLEPMIGLANRDSEKFPDSDQFSIDRPPGEHLGFGYGRHFCLGAQLARQEAAIAIETILLRFPQIERSDLVEPVDFGAAFFVRSPTQLHLRFPRGSTAVFGGDGPLSLASLWRRLFGSRAK